jgi:RimJ/RimL family protein N-acetyltransferase
VFGPNLEGERVRLAPVTPDLLPMYLRWFADVEVTRFMSLRCPPTEKMEQDWFERMGSSPNDVVWAIVLKEGDRHIGTVGIHQIDWPNRRALTGTMIGEKDVWNKGYASEAVRLRTRWAFREMGLEKLTTRVFLDNVGSRRVLEKAGYRQFGIARRDEWRDNRWHDLWLADILRDEWEAAEG